MASRRAWRVIFYQDSKGRCPVKTFLANLPVKDRAKVAAWIDLLEERGPELGRPYAARLEAGIYELRVRVATVRYRVLYFFWTGRRIVLTHGFVKKSGLVPKRELERAQRFKRDWLERHGGGG